MMPDDCSGALTVVFVGGRDDDRNRRWCGSLSEMKL